MKLKTEEQIKPKVKKKIIKTKVKINEIENMNNRKTIKEKSGSLKSLIKWIKSDADQ